MHSLFAAVLTLLLGMFMPGISAYLGYLVGLLAVWLAGEHLIPVLVWLHPDLAVLGIPNLLAFFFFMKALLKPVDATVTAKD